MSEEPILIMLAGPNGAGKSTIYKNRIQSRYNIPFINADNIQLEELKNKAPESAYLAAKIAAGKRENLIARGESFATESVFSHISKLELLQRAKNAGFRILLIHVCLRDADLAVERVISRVGEGGHTVPPDKIRARYVRSADLIREASKIADATHVFDNSSLNIEPQLMLTLRDGVIDKSAENILPWVKAIYLDPADHDS